MGNFFNSINLLGWTTVVSLLVYKFVNNPYLYFRQDLTLQIGILTIVQTLQVFDIILILLKKSKGSLLGSIAQISGRLLVAYVFLQDQTNTYSFTWMAIMWAIADIIRYSYYLFKTQGTAFARYHAFLFLYPLGVYGQMRVINDYIRRHASTLTVQQISMIRLIQAVIIIGAVFLYIYMINSRNKYYAKSAKNSQQQNIQVKQQPENKKSIQKKVSSKKRQ